MSNDKAFTPIDEEDYAEPACLLCMKEAEGERNAAVKPIQIGRMIDKLDYYFGKNDTDGALRHLHYWLEEAKAGLDKRGELAVRNELMGLCRKLGLEQEAFENCEKSVELINELQMTDNITAGTVYLNYGTVCKAFGKSEIAVEQYKKALSIYLRNSDKQDIRFAGLYNNYALALADLKKYDEATEYYFKAVEITSAKAGHQPETAITYLNIADLYAERDGLEFSEEKINDCVEKAYALLNEEQIHDGNYAYVCEKCAPVFGGFGYFLYEKELTERAKKIYEGN